LTWTRRADGLPCATVNNIKQSVLRFAALVLGGALACRGGSPFPPTLEPGASHKYVLKVAETWALDTPGGRRFDASALLWLPDGRLLTVNDQDGAVARIVFDTVRHTARLETDTGLFTPSALEPLLAEKPGRLDAEGLALDAEGRVYLSEESRRWILRCNPATGAVEKLEIDWTPVKRWFSRDPNASFEGVAIGDGRLYVANERSVGRIIEVDLSTLKVVGDFQAAPFGVAARDIHYSDLSWLEGRLWVLCRESRTVIAVDPRTHETKAQFDFGGIELAPAHAYLNPYPYGFVEGLAVTASDIWLAVDNNGFGRVKAPSDHRPSLWRCPRPDRAEGGAP
jgi:Esterase-like activity of phytase